MIEIFKISGAILGIIAFLWRVRDSFTSYLHVDVKVKNTGNLTVATAVVENKGLHSKKIDNALFLVGPEDESPINTFNKISEEAGLNVEAKYTNDIASYRTEKNVVCQDGRQLIPLAFFYCENVRVSDERLTYCSPINREKITFDRPYSVRLYIWDATRFHRSNQDCFQIDKIEECNT